MLSIKTLRILILAVILSAILADCKMLRLTLHRAYKPDIYHIADLPYERISRTFTYYVADIYLGCHQQYFQVLVDLRSTDMWVIFLNCAGVMCESPSKHKYVHEETVHSNATFYHQTMSLQYGTIQVNGTVGTDRVSFFDTTFEDQIIVFAYNIKSKYEISNMDGIIGFGMDTGVNHNISDEFTPKPLLYHMHDKGLIPRKLFSIRLEDFPKNGQLIFGIDNTLYTGKITYNNIIHSAEYRIEVDLIFVNTTVISRRQGYNEKQNVLIDLQSDVLGFPNEFYPFYETEINEQCDRLPPLKYEIGDAVFILNGKDYSTQEKSNCRVHVQNSTDWILGQPFLRKFYTIFDIDNMRIGFAKRK